MVKISVKDVSSGNQVFMKVEPEENMTDIIESASEHFRKDPGVFVLKHGKKMIPGSVTVAEAGLTEGDVLELIPDPEGGSR